MPAGIDMLLEERIKKERGQQYYPHWKASGY